jgi:hypothetical protein
VAVRIRPWSPMSARGATGRRSTFRSCRSGFESPRADHPAAQRECARVANRGRCKAARNPAWRNWLTRPPQERLNAAGSNPASMWVRIPPPGPTSSQGALASRPLEPSAAPRESRSAARLLPRMQTKGTRGCLGGRFVVSEEKDGFESRASRHSGLVVQREDSRPAPAR